MGAVLVHGHAVPDLQHVRVVPVAGPGVLLVGDAAGYYDPLTGQGISRAIRGAALAAEAGDREGALDAFASAIDRRDVAIVEYLSEPHTVADMVAHRFLYRPHVELPWADSADKAVGRSGSDKAARLNTRLSILQFLHQSLGDRFRPTSLQEKYVRAGRLGRKTGQGVFDYSEGS